MTYDEFLGCEGAVVDALPAALAALAHDRAGRWNAAHECAQARATPETDRVHAYLHRKEGDEANARYWYRRVGEAPCEGSLDDEWEALVRRFLA